jgi:hypothetical protein
LEPAVGTGETGFGILGTDETITLNRLDSWKPPEINVGLSSLTSVAGNELKFTGVLSGSIDEEATRSRPEEIITGEPTTLVILFSDDS